MEGGAMVGNIAVREPQGSEKDGTIKIEATQGARIPGDLHYFLSPSRLERLLKKYQALQDGKWAKMEYSHVINKECEVGREVRKNIVKWLIQVHQKIGLSEETYFVAVTLLDKFLHVVKVKPRYSECVAICCLYLASKSREEDHFLPTASQLLKAARTRCGVHDILRMEKIILEKLKWDINFATSWDFLHALHSLVVVTDASPLSSDRHTSVRQLNSLFRRLQKIVVDDQHLSHRPSHIAVGLLSLEFQGSSAIWLAVTKRLSDLMQVPTQTVIQLREVIVKVLGCESENRSGIHKSQISVRRRRRESWNSSDLPAKKKTSSSKPAQEEEEDIIRSIRQLYGDDEKENLICRPVDPQNTSSGKPNLISLTSYVQVDTVISSLQGLLQSTGCVASWRDATDRGVLGTSGLSKQLTYAEVVRKPAPIFLSACTG